MLGAVGPRGTSEGLPGVRPGTLYLPSCIFAEVLAEVCRFPSLQLGPPLVLLAQISSSCFPSGPSAASCPSLPGSKGTGPHHL